MGENYIVDVSMMGLDGKPRVYSKIHPCITSRIYKEPTMVISAERVDMRNDGITIFQQASKQIKVIGCMDNTMDNTFESANRVYGQDGCSPTINTCGGGDRQPKILEVRKMDVNELGFIEHGTGKHQSKIFEMDKVPSPDNLVDLYNSKMRNDGLCGTLTTNSCTSSTHCGTFGVIDAQSLRMVRTEEGKALRKAYESGEIHHGFNEHRMAEPRTDGVSNTITTVQKDNLICETIPCAMRGRNPDNPSDRSAGIPTEQRIELQEDNICNCLTSVQKDSLVLEIKSQIDEKYHPFIYEIDGEFYLIRIRKLTPRETWRLMDFSDEDFEKAQAVNSNTQLYKQSGNSIVRAVLMAIFKKLIESEG